MSAETELLLTEIQRSLHGGAWHGPSLVEAVEGVTQADAIARPVEGAHTIADLVWHIAGWMEVVAARLRGIAREEPERGNFPDREPANEAEWKQWLELPAKAFEELAQAARSFPAEKLHNQVKQPDGGRIPTYWETINGLAQHNTYHAGQIVLLKRALRQAV